LTLDKPPEGQPTAEYAKGRSTADGLPEGQEEAKGDATEKPQERGKGPAPPPEPPEAGDTPTTSTPDPEPVPTTEAAEPPSARAAQNRHPGQKEGQQVKPALPATVEIMTGQDKEATRKFMQDYYRADASKLDAALEYAPRLEGMFERAQQAGEPIKDWASRSLPYSYMTATKIRRLHTWKALLLAVREFVGDEFPIGVELGIELIKRAKAKGLAPDGKPTRPLLLELSKDAKAACDTKKAKARKAPAGAEEQRKEGGAAVQQGKGEQAQDKSGEANKGLDQACRQPREEFEVSPGDPVYAVERVHGRPTIIEWTVVSVDRCSFVCVGGHRLHKPDAFTLAGAKAERLKRLQEEITDLEHDLRAVKAEMKKEPTVVTGPEKFVYGVG
jgi:hypothetical protein